MCVCVPEITPEPLALVPAKSGLQLITTARKFHALQKLTPWKADTVYCRGETIWNLLKVWQLVEGRMENRYRWEYVMKYKTCRLHTNCSLQEVSAAFSRDVSPCLFRCCPLFEPALLLVHLCFFHACSVGFVSCDQRGRRNKLIWFVVCREPFMGIPGHVEGST